MDEVLTRKIKIYCPQHQVIFEITENPKIVCEIREHALSNDFPRGEFWEYCCDCQTFFPLNLDAGEKAKAACLQCERPTIRRFVCGECKIVSFDSGEDTKGKAFHLDADTFAISPACPGCLKDFSGVEKHLHKCAEIDAVVSTARETCPFCKKETVKTKSKPASGANCPKCKAKNEPGSFFCNDCGEQLRSTPNLEKRGSSTAKTQLLGSICPNCGASNPPNSVFCPRCGQALKAGGAKPPPNTIPPTAPSIPQSSIPTQAFNAAAAGNVTPTVKPSNSKGCFIAVGAILGGILLCAVIQGIITRKGGNDISVTTPTPSRSTSPSYTTTPGSTSAGLPDSFTNSYTGTMGGKKCTMSLTKDGTSLKGIARTSSTDYLYGTIESDGSFSLDGKKDDIEITGYYTGRIFPNGTVTGDWRGVNSSKDYPFSLSLDK